MNRQMMVKYDAVGWWDCNRYDCFAVVHQRIFGSCEVVTSDSYSHVCFLGERQNNRKGWWRSFSQRTITIMMNWLWEKPLQRVQEESPVD